MTVRARSGFGGLGRVAAVVVVAASLAACGPERPGALDAAPAVDAAATADAGDAATARPPVVIVMIGDGMGRAALEIASRYRHGLPGRLAMHGLPHAGLVRTGGPSGITDSAAAATVMATGVYTWNGRVALDRAGVPVETVIERAHARGWRSGVVTTTSLPHATPAAFTAHAATRHDYLAIADQQVRATRPHVLLGGGAAYYAPAGDGSVRADGGLHDELVAAGYAVVDDRAALAAAVAAGAPRLFGAFAFDHLTYAADRPADSGEPDLTTLTLAALDTLDRAGEPFFLLVEGGRIDHAGHGNDLRNLVHETLAFDDAVATVAAWARARGEVTLLVTADHECGGLELVAPRPPGELPEVRWRWGAHTNARVDVFGLGPGAELIDGRVVDHRHVHAVARARIDDAPPVVPPREPIADGEVGELRHRAVAQEVATGYGAGYNQLDALWLDVSGDGLHVGIEGLLEWDANAVQLWIDVDPGAATGPGGLAGALADPLGVADAVLSRSRVTGPRAPGLGFGVDLALVVTGAVEPHVEDLVDGAGLRGLRPPYGARDDLGWRRAAVNLGAVRVRDVAVAPVAGQGVEVMVPWSELYPDGPPPRARVALAALLVNSDGGHTSNQALPPFPAGTANPGRALVPLPGVVIYELDQDGDGVMDGDAPPVVVR